MGKEKPAETVSKIVTDVTNRPKRPRRRLKKKHVIIAAVVLLLVIGLVAGALYFRHDRQEKRNVTAISAKLPGDNLRDKVNSGNAAKNYDDTLTLLDAQEDQSREVLNYKASVYMNKGDYATAFDLYKKIETDFTMTTSDAANAGLSAFESKQYAESAKYYKKAADLAGKDENNSLAVGDVRRYNARAKEAEQKL